MRADGLRAKKRRRFRLTTQSDHAYAPAPNVLARMFGVGRQRADRVWAADLTYLPTREGWLYLAVILDVGTRRVVGWAVRSSLHRDRLAVHGFSVSMNRRGNCWDDAIVESFMATLKWELVAHADWRDL